MQDAVLFSGTVRENLFLGFPDVDAALGVEVRDGGSSMCVGTWRVILCGDGDVRVFRLCFEFICAGVAW